MFTTSFLCLHSECQLLQHMMSAQQHIWFTVPIRNSGYADILQAYSNQLMAHLTEWLNQIQNNSSISKHKPRSEIFLPQLLVGGGSLKQPLDLETANQMSVCMNIFIRLWKPMKGVNIKKAYVYHKRNSYFNWTLRTTRWFCISPATMISVRVFWIYTNFSKGRVLA